MDCQKRQRALNHLVDYADYPPAETRVSNSQGEREKREQKGGNFSRSNFRNLRDNSIRSSDENENCTTPTVT